MNNRRKILKALICVLLAAAIAVGGECLLSYAVFNYYGKSAETPLHLSTVIEGGSAQPDSKDCSLRLKANTAVNRISFNIYTLDAEIDNFYDISISLSYPEQPDKYYEIIYDTIGIGNLERTYSYNLKQNLKADGVEITVYNPKNVVYVSNVTANPEYERSFNYARAVIFFFVSLFALISFSFRLYFNVSFDNQKFSHKVYALVCVMLSIFLISLWSEFILTTPNEEINYPLEKKVERYNPYIQQTDAFLKGQLNIDADPPEELSKLENPYDKAQRDGIKYLWDRAYYNGKYYSYFGTGPVITLYLPYYAIKGALPPDKTVTTVYSAVFALFFSLTLIKFISVFKKNFPLTLLMPGIISSLFASLIFLQMRGKEPFYFIALISSMAFVSVFAFLMLCAFTAENKVLRKLLMAGAGLAFGLAFLSRVNTVIAPGLAAVGVVIVYIIKSIRSKSKPLPVFADLCFLAFPVIACAATAFVFNFLRFGNPLQFGTDYQLTVSDVSQNRIYTGGFCAGLYYYFFEPFVFYGHFPFFAVERGGYREVSAAYTYIDDNIGLFCLPQNIMLPTCIACIDKKKSAYEYVISACLIAGIIVTAFLNFCLGGVIFRYTGDIAFVASFCSFIIIADLVSKIESYFENGIIVRIISHCTAAVLFILTPLVSFLLSMTVDPNLSNPDPFIFEFLKHIFM